MPVCKHSHSGRRQSHLPVRIRRPALRVAHRGRAWFCLDRHTLVDDVPEVFQLPNQNDRNLLAFFDNLQISVDQQSDIPFPAVTVCNHVSMRMSYFDFVKCDTAASDIGHAVRLLQNVIRHDVAISDQWRPYFAAFLGNTTTIPDVPPAVFLAQRLSERKAFTFTDMVRAKCPNKIENLVPDGFTREQVAQLWDLLNRDDLARYLLQLDNDINRWNGSTQAIRFKQMLAMRYYVCSALFRAIFAVAQQFLCNGQHKYHDHVTNRTTRLHHPHATGRWYAVVRARRFRHSVHVRPGVMHAPRSGTHAHSE